MDPHLTVKIGRQVDEQAGRQKKKEKIKSMTNKMGGRTKSTPNHMETQKSMKKSNGNVQGKNWVPAGPPYLNRNAYSRASLGSVAEKRCR